MDIVLPGIISVFTVGNPLQDVLLSAAVDVGVLVGLVALVALFSSGIEHLFKYIVNGATGTSKTAYVIEGYLTYPGVVYHELSHALFAVLSGARVNSFSLRRRQEADGSVTLGSVGLLVSAHPLMGAFQLTLSGIAPSVMGVLAMVLMCLFAFPSCTEWWQWAIWSYLFVCVLLHSEMSRVDLQEAGRGLPIIILFLFTVFCICPIDVAALWTVVTGAAV